MDVDRTEIQSLPLVSCRSGFALTQSAFRFDMRHKEWTEPTGGLTQARFGRFRPVAILPLCWDNLHCARDKCETDWRVQMTEPMRIDTFSGRRVCPSCPCLV